MNLLGARFDYVAMDELRRTREAWLVLRFQSGDTQAFADLVEALHPPLLYYATKLTGNLETGKDVMQDMWIRASRTMGRLENPSAIRAWLYRMVHGLAIDRVRRDVAQEAADEELHEDTLSAEDHRISNYSAEAVHRALDRLAPKHREVLTLFFLEDFSIAEIREIATCSEGTVKSRLYYAKAALREALQHDL